MPDSYESRWSRAQREHASFTSSRRGQALAVVFAAAAAGLVVPYLDDPKHTAPAKAVVTIVSIVAGLLVSFGVSMALIWTRTPTWQRDDARGALTIATTPQPTPFECRLNREWEPVARAELVLTCLLPEAQLRAAVVVPGHDQRNVPFQTFGSGDAEYDAELFKGEKQTLNLGPVYYGGLADAVDSDVPASVILMARGHDPQVEHLWLRSAPLGVMQIRLGDGAWADYPEKWVGRASLMAEEVKATRNELQGVENRDEIRQIIDTLKVRIERTEVVGEAFMNPPVNELRQMLMSHTPWNEVRLAAERLLDVWESGLRGVAEGLR